MEKEIVVQLRGLNEAAYCERLFHIMYVQGMFNHNADTITGKMHHSKREKVSRNDMLEGLKLSSMVLYGMDGELSAKLDGVLIEEDEYVPIEDKNSKAPEGMLNAVLWGIEFLTSVWTNDLPQIAGQMYLLRSNGYKCSRGRVYYRGSNQMREIQYEEWMDNLVENGVKRCRTLMEEKQPAPLCDSDKCIRCSMNWVCLPDEVNHYKNNNDEPRRLYPGRPDAGILYVTSQGGKIGKSGDALTVWTTDENKSLIPLKDVEHVCVFGNVQVTTQAISEIVKRGGSISYFTLSGWFNAITSAPVTKNIQLRIEQFQKFANEEFCCRLVKKITIAKVQNQRTLLRRNRTDAVETLLISMKNYKNKIENSNNIDSIRGYEGMSAKVYWEGFSQLLNDQEMWSMKGRSKRPPKDEINAMLSYGYALLLRDVISALSACGMDYLYGFFHTIVPGRPALALDLMEPYRPLIVDSIVLRMINENMVSKGQFARTDSGVYMSPQVKNRLIYMYEKRMDEMITHPQFGYRLSYRRMVHLEARLLGKYIMGDIEEYFPLTTR